MTFHWLIIQVILRRFKKSDHSGGDECISPFVVLWTGGSACVL